MPALARRLALALPVAALVGAAAWFWPGHGNQPFTAWVPGEATTRGALMRLMQADSDIRIVAIHGPNILVIQSDAAYLPFKVLGVGAVPFSVSASDAICRS